MHTALTIAGSDSGAGAGIQADLKTFAAHGVYGTSAITAVTAQNTLGVRAWQAMPFELVVAQIDMVVGDIGADAVKIGMLGDAAVARAVASAIVDLKLPHLVVDPVMIAKGGARLLDADAVKVLRTAILPLAHIVTPNIPEAEILADCSIRSLDDMAKAGQVILGCGPQVVVVKGGHRDGADSIDMVCTISKTFELRGRRIATRNTHGTGCTLSAAIAANLANGLTNEEAIRAARRYVEGAIAHGPDVGKGHGPLHHLWRADLYSR